MNVTRVSSHQVDMGLLLQGLEEVQGLLLKDILADPRPLLAVTARCLLAEGGRLREFTQKVISNRKGTN